jgi:hypothetical protein
LVILTSTGLIFFRIMCFCPVQLFISLLCRF